MSYFAHEGITALLNDPAGLAAVERLEAESGGVGGVSATIERRDGTVIGFYALREALVETNKSPSYAETLRRSWLGGALITIADALDEYQYFDEGPDLMLVYHLRNGVAHGNRFDIRSNRRATLPAHFTGPDRRIKADRATVTPHGQRVTFEVDASMNGHPVLFDFMGPGDITSLLHFIGFRLAALAGMSLRWSCIRNVDSQAGTRLEHGACKHQQTVGGERMSRSIRIASAAGAPVIGQRHGRTVARRGRQISAFLVE